MVSDFDGRVNDATVLAVVVVRGQDVGHLGAVEGLARHPWAWEVGPVVAERGGVGRAPWRIQRKRSVAVKELSAREEKTVLAVMSGLWRKYDGMLPRAARGDGEAKATIIAGEIDG